MTQSRRRAGAGGGGVAVVECRDAYRRGGSERLAGLQGVEPALERRSVARGAGTGGSGYCVAGAVEGGDADRASGRGRGVREVSRREHQKNFASAEARTESGGRSTGRPTGLGGLVACPRITAAHTGGEDRSGLLDCREWSRRWSAEAWREALEQGVQDTALLERLREATRTGRPAGDEEFVRCLEGSTKRILRPQKRGPKAAPAVPDGQLDLGVW